MRPLRHERLEPRRLLAVSAEEVYFVYLINNLRHDPDSIGTEIGIQADFAEIASSPPLAISPQLADSASAHAQEMAGFDFLVTGQSMADNRTKEHVTLDSSFKVISWTKQTTFSLFLRG